MVSLESCGSVDVPMEVGLIKIVGGTVVWRSTLVSKLKFHSGSHKFHSGPRMRIPSVSFLL